MTTLAILRHEEAIRVDAACLVAIYVGRAKAEAEEVLGRGIEELAARVAEITLHHDRGNRVGLVRSTRLAVRLAGRLGMKSFTRVAGDLIAAAESGDRPGQAAIHARLLRIVARSEAALLDLRDMTM